MLEELANRIDAMEANLRPRGYWYKRKSLGSRMYKDYTVRQKFGPFIVTTEPIIQFSPHRPYNGSPWRMVGYKKTLTIQLGFKRMKGGLLNLKRVSI